MSPREREEAYRHAYGRLHGTYVTPRQRSDLRATMENVHAANNVHRRQRSHNGQTRSRRAGRGVYYEDELPTAPEPPRNWHRNAEYYRNRNDPYEQHNHPSRNRPQRNSGWQQDYNDAREYINGGRPRRNTTSVGHDTRDYAHLNLRFGTADSRHHDPRDSFRDRIRRWF